MNSIIGEPFLLYSCNTQIKKGGPSARSIYTSYNPKFRGHATLTTQADGIRIVDVENIHPVVSHSVGDHVSFAAPALSRCVPEDDDAQLSVTYAVIKQAPEVAKENKERTIWIMKQPLSGPRVTKEEKKVVVAPYPPARICEVDSETLPLLLVSKNGKLGLASPDVDIKSRLEWPGEQELHDVFVFPAASCSFIHRDTDKIGSVVCVCCCAGSAVYVRLVFLREEIVHLGTCELPIDDSGETVDVRIVGVTCSATGVLSFMTSRGVWNAYQLSNSETSSLDATPLTEPLQLRRFATFKQQKAGNPGIAMAPLSSSFVLLAATTEDNTHDISLQLWDLRYGVLLALQSMSPSLSTDSLPYLQLALADEGQVFLTVSPSQPPGKLQAIPRSTVHAIPFDHTLRSTLAAALGRSTASEEWLVPQRPDSQISPLDEDKANLVSAIEVAMSMKKPQQADKAFFAWIKKRTAAASVFGHEFVKRIVNAILSPNSKAGEMYSPRIMQYLLEGRHVNAIMVDGQLVSRLRDQGDWENIMLALRSIVGISEDEMISSVKYIIGAQRKRETNLEVMQVDSSEPWMPPLEMCLSACVSYNFTPVAMRLAIRKHLTDARDLVAILQTLERWLHGGTEDQMEAVFKSTVMNTDLTMNGHSSNSPSYSKVIMFLQTLLDASCTTLLQYQPSHELLKRILAEIEPEIGYIDRLEQLRGVLEPFAKAHIRMLKERAGGTPKESQAEWKSRRKRFAQQASLGVGLYRLEELILY
ncbi:hypothetical protein J3A83DRAFT_4226738 [Scleroderma citrinum]